MFGFLLVSAAESLVASSSHSWRVGVIRYPNTRLGGRLRVILEERLPEGSDPDGRVAELVRAVNRGDFD